MKHLRLGPFAMAMVLLAACGGDAPRAEPKASGDAGTGGGASSSSADGGAMNGATSGASVGAGGAGGAGGVPGDPWSGPLEALVELDLGSLAIDELHAFPVPDRTLGFTAFARGPTPADLLGIHQLSAPDGEDVVYGFKLVGHAVEVFGNEGWVAAAVPQSDLPQAMPVAEGDWGIRVGDGGQGLTTADVGVWVRRTNDGAFHGGVLDVNVFLAPGTVDEAYMTEVLAGFFPYAGLDQGEVAFFEMDATYAIIDSYVEYLEMLQTSAGIGTAPAVNVFIVGDFAKGDFKAAKGVAPGIPASAVEHGTTLSGVAFQPSGDPAHDSTILMHEIGHLAGLFHTTEIAVDENDPLADTPECAHDVITTDATACPDQDNAMFPLSYGNVAFTPQQLRVVQGSAMYRGALDANGPAAAPTRRLPAEPGGATALDRVLRSVWCHRGGDHEALVVEAARRAVPPGSDALRGAMASLRAVVIDASTAPFVRARALGALARATAGCSPLERGGVLSLAEALAGAVDAPRLLRLAALDVLEQLDGPRAQRLITSLDAGGDAVVAARASRLGE